MAHVAVDLPGSADLLTPEQYQPRAWMERDGQRVTWEACQTLNGSWGYDRDNLDWKSPELLVRLLIDTVAKGGNLLLNVGPRGEDAAIPDEQRARLDTLARWAGHGPGSAMSGSRPWVRPAGEGVVGDGSRVPLRYWAADRHVDVAVLGPLDGSLLVDDVEATPTTSVTDAASGEQLVWNATDEGIRVEVGGPADRPVLRLTDVVARLS